MQATNNDQSLLQRLPGDCLRLILENCISYDAFGPANLVHLVRLRAVCRAFDYEIMSLLAVTGLLWKSKNSSSIQQIFNKTRASRRPSPRCTAPLGDDSSAFMARCILSRPPDTPFRWNANLFSIITSVVDRIVADAGLPPDHPARLDYTTRLCRTTMPVTEGTVSRDMGIWDIFSPESQALLFPTAPHITDADLESHVLVARVLIGDATVDKEIREIARESGTKVLSIHRSKSRKTVFGGFLEAAIRARNADLARYLLSRDVDVTRHRNDEDQEAAYDGFFLELAVQMGEPTIVDALLERKITKGPSSTALVLQSVCFGHADVTKKLIHHYFPPQEQLRNDTFSVTEYGQTTTKSSAEFYYDFHQKTSTRVFGWALMEACNHRDVAAVEALLSSQFTSTAPEFVGEWNRYAATSINRWGSHSIRDLDYFDQLPVAIAVNNADRQILKMLLDHGANPHAELYYVRDEKGNLSPAHPAKRNAVKSGGSLLRVCAGRGDTETARLLLDAGLGFDTREWLVVADQLVHYSPPPRLSGRRLGSVAGVSIEDGEEVEEDERSLDAKWPQIQQFWRWLAEQGAINAEELMKECDLMLSHDEGASSYTLGSRASEIKDFLVKSFGGQSSGLAASNTSDEAG